MTKREELKSIHEDYIYSVNGRGIVIEEYVGNNQIVTIPESIEDKPITKIGNEAFEGKNVIKVYMPDTIKEIGKYAFASNMYLTEIKLSSSLKLIPEGMLSFCNKLKELTVPEKVTSIGKNSLDYVKLRKLIICSSATKISNKTFGKKLSQVKSTKFIVKKGSVAEDIILSNGLDYIEYII